jgi:hypothetical protein
MTIPDGWVASFIITPEANGFVPPVRFLVVFFVREEKAPKSTSTLTNSKVGIVGKVFSRQTHLAHLINTKCRIWQEIDRFRLVVLIGFTLRSATYARFSVWFLSPGGSNPPASTVTSNLQFLDSVLIFDGDNNHLISNLYES